MSVLSTGVLIGAGLIALTVASLLWSGARHPYTHVLAVALAMTGSCALIGAPHLGALIRWAANAFVGLLNWAGVQFIGYGFGAILAIYVTWRVAEPLVLHVKDRFGSPMPDHVITYAALLPLVVSALPGAPGQWVTTGISWTVHLVATGVTRLFGL